VPLLAGVLTLVGVLLGQVSSYLSDKRQARREDTVRWHDQVRTSCASFLTEAHNHYKGALGLDGALPVESSRLIAAFGELELVSPADIVAAADKLRNVLTDIQIDEWRTHPATAEAYAAYIAAQGKKYHDMRRALVGAIRSELMAVEDRNMTSPSSVDVGG